MNPTNETVIEQFRAAMLDEGIGFTGEIHADGIIHRFHASEDKPGSQNGWYKLTLAPLPHGSFGSWRLGCHETWNGSNGRAPTAAELAALKAKRELEERHRAKEQATAATQAAETWANAIPADETHDYLVRKQVKPHGLRQYGEGLLVLLRDVDGKIWSLQSIYRDGGKFLLDGGRSKGCFFTIGELPDPKVEGGRLIICEGFATGASLNEATGLPVVCAMNAGNLGDVAKALRERLPQVDILIAADNDAFTETGNTGVSKATAAARLIGARLAIADFTGRNQDGKPTDYNDLAALAGIGEVRKQIEAAWLKPPEKESNEEAFCRLAALAPVEYDHQREKAAGKLGIRVSTLDQEVANRRKPSVPAGIAEQGQALTFDDPEPWSGPVNGAELLDEILATLRRFVVAPDNGLVTCSLFALHTYAFDLGDISPCLFITGPTKRCGKSRLLAVEARLVNRPLATSSASAAGIYRTIELCRPTLLIDEVDTFLKGDEQLRGLINSGHTRDAAFHLGCVPVGDDFQPRRWSTWAPKIFAGIGRLADTIEDRAFIIRMQRRRKDETISRFRHTTKFEEVRRKCAKFVTDHAEAIRNADPDIPAGFNDRLADNWTPLFALADLAGGDWPAKAREAAIELTGSGDSEALGENAQLVADIRQAFGDAKTDRLPSKVLCERLAVMEGRPWAEYGKNAKPISPNQLANLLKEFGISPHGIRVEDDTPRGYLIADFRDAFTRYPADNGNSECNSATKPASIDEKPLFQGATEPRCCTLENATSPNKDGACCTVALQKPEMEGEKDNQPEAGGGQPGPDKPMVKTIL